MSDASYCHGNPQVAKVPRKEDAGMLSPKRDSYIPSPRLRKHHRVRARSLEDIQPEDASWIGHSCCVQQTTAAVGICTRLIKSTFHHEEEVHEVPLLHTGSNGMDSHFFSREAAHVNIESGRQMG